MQVLAVLPDFGAEAAVEVDVEDTVNDFCARAAAAAGVRCGNGSADGASDDAPLLALEVGGEVFDETALPVSETGISEGDVVTLRVPPRAMARMVLARNSDAGAGWPDLHAAWDAGNLARVSMIIQAGVDRKACLIARAMEAPAAGGRPSAAAQGVCQTGHGSSHGTLAETIAAAATTEELDDRDSTRALTPLMHAVQADALPFVRYLLTRGVDVNAANVHGYTALMYAAARGATDCCALLLDHGAAVDHNDPKRLSPLCNAAHNGHVATAELLLSRGPSLRRALYHAAQEGSVEMCALLIAHGADVNEMDPRGRATPLHVAAGNAFANCVNLLLSHNAAVNTTNNMGITPAMFAARSGAADCLEALLVASADYDAVDCEGRSAAFLASLFTTPGHAACLALLQERGAVMPTGHREYEPPALFS